MSRPRVRISEVSIPSAQLFVATGRLAYVVQSTRGYTGDYLYIENEQDLVDTIGEPNDDATSRDFHVCKAFLQYGNDLVLRRAYDPDTVKLPRIGFDFSSTGITDTLSESGDEVFFEDKDNHTIKSGMDLEFYAKEPESVRTIKVAFAKTTVGQTGVNTWQDDEQTIDGTTKFSDEFEYGPSDSKKEIAVAVIVDGTIEEKFIVSLDPDNINDAGFNNYIEEELNSKSAYIWGFSSSETVYDTLTTQQATTLADGSAGSTPTKADFETAYSKFKEKTDIEFDYIIDGTHWENRSYIIDSIAGVRKDCIAYVGVPYNSIIGVSSTDTIVDNIVSDIQTLAPSEASWASYSSNWKQVYDKYRAKNVWIPLTGDVAGNKVRVNTDREVWTPAAGNTNGRVKDVIKLAFNPTASQQDRLYKNGANHIVFKPGKGYIIDGQKTMLNQNVGVSRVNIRDLFRVVEQYVSSISEDFLHEFNDEQTRARWRSLVNPFLEDILNRGGLIDYRVICDESNNTDAVIDSFGFRGDVLLKGKRPIEDILIRFFDTPAGVGFEEVTG